MTKALKIALACVVGLLALYGIVSLASGLFFTEYRGKETAKAMHPFLKGVATGVREDVKQSLSRTPDAELQKESYEMSRKMYPVLKGALLGQAEAFAKDPRRDQFQATMREAGKVFATDVVGPFTQGFAEGSGQVVGELDRTLEGVRKLGGNSKDLLDALATGVGKLKKALKGFPPPVPPGAPGESGIHSTLAVPIPGRRATEFRAV